MSEHPKHLLGSSSHWSLFLLAFFIISFLKQEHLYHAVAYDSINKGLCKNCRIWYVELQLIFRVGKPSRYLTVLTFVHDQLARSMEKSNVIETYMDIVPDMEDVLFDTHGSGHQVFEVGKPFHLHPHPLERDGSLTASMSGRVQGSDLRPFQLSGSQSVEVLWAEVVGAHQQQGGASFGDRVVGIQDHTVYRILVRGIDGKEWEVERRYREFVALHQQLSRRFSSQAEIALPACWEKVQSESWKLFGHTSPNVVEARSALIHACLQSLLRAGPPLNNAAPLLRFLFPTGYSIPPPGNTRTPANARSSDLEGEVGGSHFPLEDFGANYAEHQDSPRSDILEPVMKPVLGSSIRLILQVHKKRALKQQLRAQQHMCAGCHMHLEIPIGLVSSLVQSFGLGEPRWCEYSGQLYCSTCHLNETAVIPAHVLHFWDFTPHKVSQLAKAYLDSIYNQVPPCSILFRCNSALILQCRFRCFKPHARLYKSLCILN